MAASLEYIAFYALWWFLHFITSVSKITCKSHFFHKMANFITMQITCNKNNFRSTPITRRIIYLGVANVWRTAYNHVKNVRNYIIYTHIGNIIMSLRVEHDWTSQTTTIKSNNLMLFAAWVCMKHISRYHGMAPWPLTIFLFS